MRENVKCPLCHKENRVRMPEVPAGEPYKLLWCTHQLGMPYATEDFLCVFLKQARYNRAMRVPELDCLGEIPTEVLENNRENLIKVLKEELHEVDGWWFGTIEQRQEACKRLMKILKPLCDFYAR